MKYIPKVMFPYLISIFLSLMIVYASRPVSSLFADELKASVLQVGLLTICFSILPLVMAVRVGTIIDRYGSRIPMLFSSIGMALSVFIPYVFPTLTGLYVSQLLMGVCQMTVYVALQNGVGKASADHDRDNAMSNLSLFTSAGMLLGPIVGGYISTYFGYRMLFLFMTFVALLLLITSLFLKRETPGPKKQASDPVKSLFSTSILKLPGLGRSVLVSMLILTSMDIFIVYLPIYAKSLGIDSVKIGWLISIQAGAALGIRFFIPPLVKRLGRVKTLWLFMIIGACAYAMLSLFSQFNLLMMICILLGIGLGICQPLILVLTYNSGATEGRTAEALSIRVAGNRLAQMVIPFSMAGVSHFTGLGFIFMMQSTLLFLGVWIARGIDRRSEM